MGSCLKIAQNKKNKEDKEKMLEETDTNEPEFDTFSEKQLRCLQLIFKDLSSRSENDCLTFEHFRDFFHVNSVLGGPLFTKFKKVNEDEMTQEEFLDNFKEIFNGKTHNFQLLKLTFEVLDVWHQSSLTFADFVNVVIDLLFQLLGSPSKSIRSILKDDGFINTLTAKQISYYIGSSNSNPEKYEPKHYQPISKTSKDFLQNLTNDKCFPKAGKSAQEKAQQSKQNLKKMLKSTVDPKTCCTSIIPQYVEYLFESMELRKETDALHYNNFLWISKDNRNILECLFEGFHEYIWKHQGNIPLYKSLVPIQEDHCTEKVLEHERPVYILLIKTTLLVFESEEMSVLLSIKNLEGLNVLPVQGTFGYGFKLYHQNGIYPQASYYFQNFDKQVEWLSALKLFVVRKMEQKYRLVEKISSNRQNEIHICEQLKTGQKYIAKIKKPTKLSSPTSRDPESQPQILSLCCHKNIPKLLKTFSSKKSTTLILQKPPSPTPTTLKSFLSNLQKSLKQSQIKSIIQQILSPLQYLHNLGILHRNLNSQNILIDRDGDTFIVFLVGFSYAMYKIGLGFGNRGRDFFNSGGALYIAKEILAKEDFDQGVDLYAVGVCMWEMVTGEFKVQGKGKPLLDFDGMAWERIGSKAKDFISRLLCKKETRLNADDALRHQWFRG